LKIEIGTLEFPNLIIMKKLLYTLISILLISCSPEENSTSKDGLDLLIGKWLFRYENDYNCDVQPGDKITSNQTDFYYIFSNNGILSRQNEESTSRPFAKIEDVSLIDSEGNISVTITYLETNNPKPIVIRLYDNNQKMLFNFRGCGWLEFHKT
jgi:hypothetical protein